MRVLLNKEALDNLLHFYNCYSSFTVSYSEVFSEYSDKTIRESSSPSVGSEKFINIGNCNEDSIYNSNDSVDSMYLDINNINKQEKTNSYNNDWYCYSKRVKKQEFVKYSNEDDTQKREMFDRMAQNCDKNNYARR